MLSSISGGTDVCTAFVGGCPLVEVRAGEIPCGGSAPTSRRSSRKAHRCRRRGRAGGDDPDAVDAGGASGATLTAARLHATYFENFPGVWRHGDWITVTERWSCVIYGAIGCDVEPRRREDGHRRAVLGRRGHRRRADSLVVHLEDEAGHGSLVLLVVAPESAQLRDTIKQALRSALSPRHVPDEIYVVRAIPRTLSGKKLELPVKRILAGERPADVASRDALSDPSALDEIEELARTRLGKSGPTAP